MSQDRGLAAIRAAAESTTSAAAIIVGAAAPGGRKEPAKTEVVAAINAVAADALGESAAAAAAAAIEQNARLGTAPRVATLPEPNAKQDERARIAAIVGAPEAKGREGLAQHLAFNTDTPAPDAIAMLKAAPAAAPERTSRLDAVMAEHQPKIAALEGGNSAKELSAGLSTAVKQELKKIGKQPLAV